MDKDGETVRELTNLNKPAGAERLSNSKALVGELGHLRELDVTQEVA